MTTTHDPARPLLTVPEVADRLRVSVKTVRRRIESGELSAVRIGTGIRAPVRVDRDALEEFLHPVAPTRSVSPGPPVHSAAGGPGAQGANVRITDALKDRAAARLVLDPADARFAIGSEEERTKARQEWHRARFTHEVMGRDDLVEVPRSRLQPLHGPRLLEDTATGDLYVPRRDGLIDLDYVPDAVAYYCAADGTPVLLERPSGGMPQTRAELERRRAEREQRRNAPRPRRQVKRR